MINNVKYMSYMLAMYMIQQNIHAMDLAIAATQIFLIVSSQAAKL